MSQPIYLVIGCPGSGKSWVCEKLTQQYEYVHHDGYIYLKQPGAYVKAILQIAPYAKKPLLCEAPFSISETKKPLEAVGYKVIPVFIIEPEIVVSARYMMREKKPIPQGHLSRMRTYAQRAREWKAFCGTSQEVLQHLQRQAARAVPSP